MRRMIGLAVAALALASCSTGTSDTSSGETETSNPSGSAAAEGVFPVTIDHAFGDTTIEQAPTRVVTVGWTDQDTVLALGVVPVGATKITWGGTDEGSTPWFDEALDAAGGGDVARFDETDGIPLEEIAALEPDLILGTNSGMTQEEYDKLAKIANTVAYPEGPWITPWEDSLDMIGQALGKPEEAAKLAEDTNTLIDTEVAKYPESAGKKVAWGWFTPADMTSVGLYSAEDLRPQMLRRFGFTDPDILTTADPKDGSYSMQISAENASDIDADVLVFYAESADAEELKADPLLGQIPALKNDSYVASADNTAAVTMSSPTVLSIPVALDTFLPKIDQAASGTPAE